MREAVILIRGKQTTLLLMSQSSLAVSDLSVDQPDKREVPRSGDTAFPGDDLWDPAHVLFEGEWEGWELPDGEEGSLPPNPSIFVYYSGALVGSVDKVKRGSAGRLCLFHSKLGF